MMSKHPNVLLICTDHWPADMLDDLTQILMDNLYGDDRAWIRDSKLIGLPDMPYKRRVYRDLFAQRGLRFV